MTSLKTNKSLLIKSGVLLSKKDLVTNSKAKLSATKNSMILATITITMNIPFKSVAETTLSKAKIRLK